MEIKTSDLITLQNHARAFKQNDFIFYNHYSILYIKKLN